MPNLIVILGDQLSLSLSSLADCEPAQDHIMMAEVMQEGTYVPHHKKKLVFVFSAMRHFAQHLEQSGYTVHYSPLDADNGPQSLIEAIEARLAAEPYDRLIMTEAGEWRLREDFEAFQKNAPIPVEIRKDDRFLCSEDNFQQWASGRKQLRMEYFYREMRRKTGLLMDDDTPIGGQWNYDSENRKPASEDLFMPHPPEFPPDAITQAVMDMVTRLFPDHMGDVAPFWFAVTAKDAEKAADLFIRDALKDFGTYQDAMVLGQKFLYHSVLSPYINIGLLDPIALCQRVEQAYHDGNVPLNSAEGFIRQIIGWREFVRGIYFLKMPDYAQMNALEATNPLPDFYWTGETDMLCMREAIGQTIDGAYAHHIQRLMVTGNFALIAGINPQEVHEWYLAVYADAYEWVELPNTIGMSQFADGGILGSKPYAASGNYIHKMSNYCQQCQYNVKEKIGPNSCPFNSLYWDFMIRNRERLSKNPRVSRVYTTWDRMKSASKNGYLQTAMEIMKKISQKTRL